MCRIILAETDEDVHQASILFQKYAASLGVDLSFQNFEHELATLPGDYAPPAGRLLLAYGDVPANSNATARSEDERASGFSSASSAPAPSQSVAGCVALRRHNDETCEMKRLYVRPQFRGKGAGKELAKAVIQAAREMGYRSMLLDTLPQMAEAQGLYHALGFREIAAYRHNPIPGSRYLKLRL
jgi:ribosomal protein S18 acetylase RimI-like enzyme